MMYEKKILRKICMKKNQLNCVMKKKSRSVATCFAPLHYKRCSERAMPLNFF